MMCCTYYIETENGNIYLSSENNLIFVFNKNESQDLIEQKTLISPITENTQIQLKIENEALQICKIKSSLKINTSENSIIPFLSEFVIDKNGCLYIKKYSSIYNLNLSIFDILKKPKIINGVVFCVNKYVILHYTTENTIIFIIKLVLHITNGTQSRKLLYNYIYSPYEGKAKIKFDGSVLEINENYFNTENIDAIVKIYKIRKVADKNFLECIYKEGDSDIAENESDNKIPFIGAFIACCMLIWLIYRKEKAKMIIIEDEISLKKGYGLYNGLFNKNSATIKVYKKNDLRYKNEINIMSILQRQNIVKYYFMEAYKNEIRLVFEPTAFIDRKLTKQEIHCIFDVIYEMNKIGIVYNNLALENIRLNNHGHLVLTNFEDAHIIDDEAIFYKGYDLGTPNWRCTDVILHNKGLFDLRRDALCKVDVFSLGILLYYNETMTNPFETHNDSIEQNIVTNQYVLQYISDHSLHDLICHCIKIKYEERITIKDAINHPYFWSAEKKFNFLANLSDFIENKMETSKRVFLRLERNKHKIFQELWSAHLDLVIIDELKNFRCYNEKNVKGLLRAIRNKGRHFKELPDEIKIIYKSFPDGYMQYYTSRFPSLLMVCHYSAKCISDDELMATFYNP